MYIRRFYTYVYIYIYICLKPLKKQVSISRTLDQILFRSPQPFRTKKTAFVFFTHRIFPVASPAPRRFVLRFGSPSPCTFSIRRAAVFCPSRCCLGSQVDSTCKACFMASILSGHQNSSDRFRFMADFCHVGDRPYTAISCRQWPPHTTHSLRTIDCIG